MEGSGFSTGLTHLSHEQIDKSVDFRSTALFRDKGAVAAFALAEGYVDVEPGNHNRMGTSLAHSSAMQNFFPAPD